jgi:hypothetical protein
MNANDEGVLVLTVRRDGKINLSHAVVVRGISWVGALGCVGSSYSVRVRAEN